MRYQFIYNAKESRYCGVDCYYIYDTKDKKHVYDLFENIGCVHVDRQKKIIYFYGMHVKEYWILEKYYFDIIQEFLDLAEAFEVIGYTVDEDCVGGKIYYKYK